MPLSLRAMPEAITKRTLNYVRPILKNVTNTIFSSKNSNYYTVNELNQSETTFKILSCNVRSLHSNFNAIRDLILETKCSILALQEIWQIHNDTLFEIPGYDLIYNTRKKSPGGGTGFYIKSNIEYEVKEHCMYEKILEASSIIINAPLKKKLIINNIYLGHKNKRQSIDKLDKILQWGNKLTNCDRLLLGDFNVDLLKTTAITTEFENLMVDHGLMANINVPTRVEIRNNNITYSLIDNIFSKMNFQGFFFSVVSQIADHLVTGVDISLNQKPRKDPPKTVTFRKFSPDKMALVSSDLNQVNWQQMLDMNLDDMVEFLTNKINESINKHLPLTTKIITKKSENVWFTKGLQKSKLKLRQLEKKFAQDQSIYNRQQLTNYNKIYKSLIRHAKNNYYNYKLSNAWGDSRKQWRLIDEICGRASKDNNIIKALKINSVKTTDSAVMAETFCEFFANIGNNISKKYKTNNDYLSHIDNLDQHKNHFELKPSSISRTKKFISTLKNKSSFGHDGISNKTVKCLKNEISRPLTYIINKSLETSSYPTKWKISKCFPLYKKNEKDQITNYRPISLQNCLSKVLEKTVKSQVVNYLETNDLLPNNQFGFRDKQGINHLHLKLNQEITATLSKKQVFKIALLDFSKAFDLVNHQILLKKLKALGCNEQTVSWFKSYLSDRYMYCVVNGKESGLRLVPCGVPQGTCLGPLLFLCYTFDITSITKDYLCFADDTSIGVKSNEEATAATKLEELLKIFNNWVVNNKLELNWNKSKIITFGADKTKLINLTRIKINNIIVEEVNEYKLLGITIDRKLSWSQHITNLSNSLKYINFTLNRIKNFTPTKTMLLIYNSLFQSKLSFGLPIWSGLFKGQLKQLEIMQKKAIRAVYRCNSLTHTEPLFRKGEIMPLEDLITYHNALLARSIRINPPNNTKLLLTDPKLPPGATTRGQIELEKVTVPNFKLFKYNKQACVKIPQTWNSIPYDIKMSTNNTFKKTLKKYLFEKRYPENAA